MQLCPSYQIFERLRNMFVHYTSSSRNWEGITVGIRQDGNVRCSHTYTSSCRIQNNIERSFTNTKIHSRKDPFYGTRLSRLIQVLPPKEGFLPKGGTMNWCVTIVTLIGYIDSNLMVQSRVMKSCS